MNISWYGQRCVRIECREGSVLADPFDPKDTGLRGPVINDDLVLLSAYDQPAALLERIGEGPFLVRGPGEYERKGIAVRGIPAFQDSQSGRELGLATIYRVTAEDVTVCCLGALGQDKLTDEQLEDIGDPDILVIPPGTQSALDAKALAAVVTAIEPKVVLALGSYDAFIKQLGLAPQKTDTYRIQKKSLPVDQTVLVVLTS
ncbi:MAG TPA: MBL fold metallo-hydrolase [Candidatus Paceibacterota bacterium]|nr:MBL fold metallo-hydrolase [Candidatus Paceibacterota bacterium]